jgi:hypothetical protein
MSFTDHADGVDEVQEAGEGVSRKGAKTRRVRGKRRKKPQETVHERQHKKQKAWSLGAPRLPNSLFPILIYGTFASLRENPSTNKLDG